MTELLSTFKRIARKDYEDMAGIFIRENLYDIRRHMNTKLTFSEWRAIATLKANGWKIKKGQQYDCSGLKSDDHGLYTFRCLPEIHAICHKYELYPED